MSGSSNRTLFARHVEAQNSTRNYIENSSAHINTTGWATYADAAGSRPVDGTGGSSNVTWSRNTTTPLSLDAQFQFVKDSNNRQGQGVSYDFTIDRADRAKLLQVSFDYELVSGTYSNGTASTDSDMIVYLYDVTNARLIEPQTFKIDAATASLAQFKGIFQTSADSSSYRLIFHVATTSAVAYTLNIDRVSVAQSDVVYNSPMTNWVAYTPTGGWSTNATYAGQWRRVGDSVEIKFQVSLSGAPTGNLNAITLPAGLVLDTAKLGVTSPGIDNTNFGPVAIEDNGAERYVGYVAYQSTTTVQMLVNNASGTYDVGRSVNATTPITFGASDKVTASFSLPVTGWASSTLSTNDADQRVMAARLTKTGNQTIITSTQTLVTWDAKTYDTHNAFDLGTERFTAPQAGFYRVHARISYTTAVVAVSAITLRKNGVAVSTMFRSDSVDGQYSSGSDTIQLNAGDYLELYVNQNTGSNRDIDGTATGFTYLDIERVQGPSAITATETIAMTAYLGTNTAFNTTIVKFDTKEFDTHSAYSISTGQFTCPAAGIYRVSGIVTLASGTPDVVRIRKNTTTYQRCYLAANAQSISYSVTIQCVAGDTLNVLNQGTNTVQAGDHDSTISIERIGV